MLFYHLKSHKISRNYPGIYGFGFVKLHTQPEDLDRCLHVLLVFNHEILFNKCSRQKRGGAPPPVATVQPSSPSKLPQSVKNIKKLSVDNSYVTIENNNNTAG